MSSYVRVDQQRGHTTRQLRPHLLLQNFIYLESCIDTTSTIMLNCYLSKSVFCKIVLVMYCVYFVKVGK